MEDSDKKKKSPHLQQLEEAFEKRTRRFSAFEVLGLTPEGDQKAAENHSPSSGTSTSASGPNEPSSEANSPVGGSTRYFDGSERHVGVSNTPPQINSGKIFVRGMLDTPIEESNTPLTGPFGPTYVSSPSSAENPYKVRILDHPQSVSDRHSHGGNRPIHGIALQKDVVVVNKTTTWGGNNTPPQAGG
jgi:hypothetical protein